MQKMGDLAARVADMAERAKQKAKREPLPEGGGRIKMTSADFTNALFAAVVRP